MYMNYTLENGENQNQYISLQNWTILQKQNFILSLTIESIEKEIYKYFFQKTIELLHKDKDYPQYDSANCWVLLHSSNFTANRSYVIMSFKPAIN
jgi:hypothetical protein